ncbi:MAG: type IV secretory system conjugative DNA transfer family protein, partial [Treponema sp.]|nr:type IV secretory system conjugative DNA transfer family protein [Treponema sp.]
MSRFIKDGINEFRREKPASSGMSMFSLVHKIIPIIICMLSLVIATQYLAYRFNFNPAIIGYPWFVFSDYPVYYPFLIFAMFVKGISGNDPVMGNTIFESIMLMVTGIFFGVVVYFVLSWARTAASKKQNIHGTSRWGTEKDIRAIGLFEEAGVVLGQHENAKVDYAITNGSVKLSLRSPSKIMRHSGQTSTIMFAPTRSGKGVSSVIPTCIDYPHSLITIDPKGENYNITAGWRRKFSHVLRLSPVSKDTLKFNILDELTEDCAYRDASMIADILTSPADGKVDGSSKHWTDTAKDLITGVILHVKCSDYRDKSLYGVLAFLSQATNGGDNDKGMALL